MESVTHCSISGSLLRIVSEVNWGRRGDIWKRKTSKLSDTARDRTKGREAGSSGDRSSQLSARDKLVIDKAETVGCDVVGAAKTVDIDRFNFLSFWNRSVKAILLVCGNFRA